MYQVRDLLHIATGIFEVFEVKLKVIKFEVIKSIDRIRPPKREQVQFLFPSLGSCTAGAQLQYAVSKRRCALNLHIIFDESAPSSALVGSTELRSTHPAMRCKPRLGNKN
jgi:hypothetical protein